MVARKCGFLSAEAFLGEYEKITRGVHQRFVRFFKQDLGDVDRVTRDLIVILDRQADPKEAAEALARQGLDHPDALRLLHDLAFGTREVFVSAGGQRSFEQMLPSLLRLIASAPRPDRVLPHLHSFMHAIKGMTYYFEVIAQHPDILKLLVALFGTSDTLARSMISRPEYFDAIISTMALHELDARGEEVRKRLTMALNPRMPKRRLVMLRRTVQFEVLLVALRFLLDLRPLPSSLRTLTKVADEAVAVGMKLACQRLVQRNAERFEPVEGGAGVAAEQLEEFAREHFGVIALGKYGGTELNFFGDLDVVFVYDSPENETDTPAWLEGWSRSEFFNELADSLTLVLAENLEGGRVFILDARLRPYGAGAPLATALEAYERYLQTEAAVWEIQATLRMRRAWGPRHLPRRMAAALEDRRQSMNREEMRQEVLAMRKRLQDSAGPGGADGGGEFKRGEGGIVDAEFAMQYLALAGVIEPGKARRDYFTQLDRLVETGPMPLRKPLMRMCHAYRFLRRLETACRLVGGEGRSTLPADGLGMAVARMMGFIGDDALEALKLAMAEVRLSMRESFDEVMLNSES